MHQKCIVMHRDVYLWKLTEPKRVIARGCYQIAAREAVILSAPSLSAIPFVLPQTRSLNLSNGLT